jgi:hypothetical protein
LTQPLSLVVDRAIAVAPGHVVRTDYVRVEDVVLACRERMAIGDVDRAFQKRLQIGDHQPWPCPRGAWREDGRFEIVDGRHEYVATLMLGHSHILVAWEEPRSGAAAELPPARAAARLVGGDRVG